MPWNNKASYWFNEQSINANAPAASGVYALYDSQKWVYIGESNNIRRRLLEHYNEAGTCIKRQQPSSFSFELAADGVRVSRQNGLILELRPACNQMLG